MSVKLDFGTMGAMDEELLRTKGSKGLSYFLMICHLCSDINQGALIAIIPFLVIFNDFSYAAATMLLFASNIASAIIQPLFGWLGDRVARPWFMALGITLAGVGMAGIGLTDNYWAIIALAMLSGIGVAIFHPEGGRLANLVAGMRKSSGMSIFAVGGKLGFSIGPLIATVSLAAFGLPGTLVFLIPSLLCSFVLLLLNSKLLAYDRLPSVVQSSEALPDDWKSFSLLMVVLSSRSIVYFGLLAFIPLFLMANLAQTEELSSSMLTLFAAAGALSTFFSGWLAERIGTKRLMIIGYGLLAILVAIFTMNSVLVFAIILIPLLATMVDVSYPSSVALGQSYVPNHLGMASGLSFGVMVCIGGIASPLLGMVGDATGLEPVLFILVLVALIATIFSCIVPAQAKYAAEEA